MWRSVVVLIVFGLQLSAVAQESATWDVIRHDIFGANCASCHTAGTSFAEQSGLLLTPEVAYDQLINVAPRNEAARNDGLVRVSSTAGIAGLEQSFLWEKINTRQRDHLYEDHPDYGALMPLGGSLTNGELDFIGNWLLSGAPDTGVVADPLLLNDTSIYEPHEFEPLPVPEHGIQLHLGPFEAWPAEKYDREFYYFEPIQIDEPVYLDKYEIRFREGSHHFILYHYEQGESTPEPGVYRDFRDADGKSLIDFLGDASRHAAFLAGTQSSDFSYQLPEGVALRLSSTAGFDLSSHTVNRTDEPREGEVYVNLHTANPSDIIHVAEQKNFANFFLNIPPNRVTTISKTFTFREKEHIIQMWSHAHESMAEFRVEHVGGDQDGELIYWNNDWEHPPLATYDDPLVFEAGDQIRLVTTYNNQTDQAKRFGFLSTDEMQFLFYVSYPLTGDFQKNGVLDEDDLTELDNAIGRGTYRDNFDLDHDGNLDESDRVFWIEKLAQTRRGDVNLDGLIGFDDFLVLSENFGQPGGWSDGNFDGDGVVGFTDFLALSSNFGFENSRPVQVPEPSGGTLLVLACTLIGLQRQRHRSSNDSPLC